MMAKLQMLLNILPGIKGWLWADGKFSTRRGVTLIGAGIGLGAGIYFLGAENTAILVDMLDDISDIIGYE